MEQTKILIMELTEKVRETIANQLGIHIKEVTDSANLVNDLQVDSLDIVELIAEFERAYEISILDSDLENILTVKDAIKYLEGLISNK